MENCGARLKVGCFGKVMDLGKSFSKYLVNHGLFRKSAAQTLSKSDRMGDVRIFYRPPATEKLFYIFSQVSFLLWYAIEHCCFYPQRQFVGRYLDGAADSLGGNSSRWRTRGDFDNFRCRRGTFQDS